MTHANSTAAFHAETDAGRINRRERQILDAASTAQASFTDRRMAELLGYTDMNSVRPRITSLIQMGLLVECGKTRCPVTGKRVRLSRAATPAEIREHIQKRHRQSQPGQLPLL